MTPNEQNISQPTAGKPSDFGSRDPRAPEMPRKPKQRAQFRWLIVNFCFNLIAINVDKIALVDHFDLAIAIRVLVVTPLFLVGVALHLWASNLNLRSFATGAATIAFIATVAGLAQFANDTFSSRYLMIATFMLFVAILFSGLRWRATQITAAIAFVAFGFLAVVGFDLQIRYMNIDLIFLCGSTACLALVLRRRQDLQMSEIFAMREIDARRALELQEANSRLARLSNTDPLTGLFNRRYLDALIVGFKTSLAPQSGVGVLMIDIDHFKTLNDRSGHAEGDRCLRRIAAVIQGCAMSSDDTVVRYGGEEFAMILGDADARETLAVAERVRCAIADLRFPNQGLGPDRFVTVSIGAHLAAASEDLAGALVRADELLYEAKKSGRNRVAIRFDAQAAANG